jgi:RAD51-like protein 2
LALVKELPKFLAAHKSVRLVIVDSVAFHFRRGFDDMALRARTLTGMAQSFLEMADRFQLAVRHAEPHRLPAKRLPSNG